MIYLMRHGADPSDRYGGWSTYGLTEKGKEQVHNAKGQLRNTGITQIYASDLVRAKETAEIIAPPVNRIIPIITMITHAIIRLTPATPTSSMTLEIHPASRTMVMAKYMHSQ